MNIYDHSCVVSSKQGKSKTAVLTHTAEEIAPTILGREEV